MDLITNVVKGGPAARHEVAGGHVVLANGMVDLAGDEQVPGDHVSSLPFSTGLGRGYKK